MPGGHCPIVRPHPHQTKRTYPGRRPAFKPRSAAWRGAHTKQASPKPEDPKRRRSNLYAKRRGYESSFLVFRFWFCVAWVCVPRVCVRVRIHAYAPAHVFMHPDHYFGSPKPWFFDTRFGVPKRCPKTMFFGPENHPP